MSIQQNFPGFVPSLNLNFARSERLDPRVTFSRETRATRMNPKGFIEVVNNNVPRLDHSYDAATGTVQSLGLLIEEQRTNEIVNNTMIGAVAGSPGTPPTGWLAINRSNLTWSITGTGIDSGVNYVDLRLSGTSNATSSPTFTFGATGEISASNGQTWTTSCFIKLVSGSTSGITNIGLANDERSTTYLTGGNSQNFLLSINSSTGNIFSSCRYVFTRTNTNASTTSLLPYLIVTPSNGATIDMTLRIGMPQTELGAFPTTVIPTAGLPATRLADVALFGGTNFTSVYNQIEGSYRVEGIINANLGANIYGGVFGAGALGVSGGNGTSNFIFYNPSNTFGQYVSNSGQNPASQLSKIYTVGAGYKIAGAYANNDFACSFNGDISSSTTNNALYRSFSYFSIGNNAINRGDVKGSQTIANITYYPRRLTNAQLQELTR